MASPTADLTSFAQSIYLTIKNRYFDEITGEDGQVFLQQVCDWTNMFIDELENETGPNGQLVDWWFMRDSGTALGTATEGESSIGLPTTIDRLLTDENRYVQILDSDGKVLSNWLVVHPKDINNRTGTVQDDMCAVVGSSIVFSRPFKDTENNGNVIGDTVGKIPRMTFTLNSGNVQPTNVKALSTVRPKQLLILGVAKNATLPDIVQGGLSPSYVQKFNDLLNGAIARSNASSVAAQAARDNLSHVRGVY